MSAYATPAEVLAAFEDAKQGDLGEVEPTVEAIHEALGGPPVREVDRYGVQGGHVVARYRGPNGRTVRVVRTAEGAQTARLFECRHEVEGDGCPHYSA